MIEPLECLAFAPPEETEQLATSLSAAERRELKYHWHVFARPAQLAPPGDWRVWLVMAGRGFGKTRAGAEWVRAVAEANPDARIALVSASLAEARAVMVEGESGVLACSPPDRRPLFEPSLRRLRFPGGAQAFLFSALEPEALRGPQHSHARRTSPKGGIPQPGDRIARRPPSACSGDGAGSSSFRTRGRNLLPRP